ncbi:hypothetical protein OAA19_00215 [Rubripirellula sp.]|nr:hypothetical protein [Rubripirellula sp.]MDB4338510.1 hypothetical protein [Rubripirellula sp.]
MPTGNEWRLSSGKQRIERRRFTTPTVAASEKNRSKDVTGQTSFGPPAVFSGGILKWIPSANRCFRPSGCLGSNIESEIAKDFVGNGQSTRAIFLNWIGKADFRIGHVVIEQRLPSEEPTD